LAAPVTLPVSSTAARARNWRSVTLLANGISKSFVRTKYFIFFL
jgi:hypothetical protein